ncbi:hypothetical protein [Flavisolibacter tropicus]|uniref:hypothetical protein n=1 Tax=Flavisolibacter tropicus TaxID=1492898 RepID=UPI0009ED4E71|nr:hypothetical protein [Flavisolibacter tropicus]
MDKRSQVKSGVYYGITMSLFFILQNLLTDDNLTGKKIALIIFFGLFGGGVSGLLFGWIMGLFVRSKHVTQATRIDTAVDETILFETGANHFKGAEGVGGKLYLTNKRLVFKSHKYNIQNHELSMRLSDIDKADRYKTLGIVNNGLAVTTAGGTIEKFVVQQPDQWLSQLTEKSGLQELPI